MIGTMHGDMGEDVRDPAGELVASAVGVCDVAKE
jgi:hypothetical protein